MSCIRSGYNYLAITFNVHVLCFYWSLLMILFSFRSDNLSLLEPKWIFEGHQLGVISVATDTLGKGTVAFTDRI